jgi:hypothetical protein
MVLKFECIRDTNPTNTTKVRIKLVLKDGTRRHSRRCLNIERKIENPQLQLATLTGLGKKQQKCNIGLCAFQCLFFWTVRLMKIIF